MRTTTRGLALLAVLLAAAPAASDASCVQLQTSRAENPERPESRFSATTTSDVVFRVAFKVGSLDGRLLELRVFTPRGHLYQSLAVPLASRDGASARKVPGYPRPVKAVVPATAKVGGVVVLQVDVPFPVGGTMIQSSGLYGAWRVEAFLDDADVTCGKAASFTINP